MKNFIKQFVAYFKPIKGHGTIGMFQRTIVYSEWVLIVSVIVSIILECNNNSHEGWIQFFENYAIGTACSVVIVLVTVITQFISVRSKAFDDFHSNLFHMLSSFCRADDIKENGKIKLLPIVVKELDEDTKNCRLSMNDLFWFRQKYNNSFHEIERNILILIIDQQKEYPPKDLYVDKKDINKCLSLAKDFKNMIQPNSFNLFEVLERGRVIKDTEEGE